jgi:hypothetical protein
VSEPASIPRTGRHSALAAIVAVVVIALASIGMIKMFRSSESQAVVPASESPAAPGCAAPAAPTVPADPGNKPVTTTHLSISPIGPLRDGFAVSLYQTSPDGARAWFCWVDRASDWHPLQVPAAGEAFGAVSDGTSLALPDIGDEDDHLDDALVVTRSGSSASAIALRTAGDDAWLADWSFWGELRPLREGGFLLARGTRLAILKGGALTFRDMPDGLTPLAPTSDPRAWLVARIDDREAGGAIRPPFRLWREGQAEAQVLSGEWSEIAPATVGLAWLRSNQPDDNHWALLRSDGSIEPRAADGALPGSSSMAPDGSAELVVSGDGCYADTPEACDVRLVNPANGARVTSLPGLGQIAWGEGSALFVVGRPASSQLQPQLLLIRDGNVNEIHLP